MLPWQERRSSARGCSMCINAVQTDGLITADYRLSIYACVVVYARIMLPLEAAYRGPQLTSLSNFGMAAHLRTFCSCLLPARASLQHSLHLRYDALLYRLEAASRCFGQPQRTGPFSSGHSITTCNAAKVSRSGSALTGGEYDVDQIQVLRTSFLHVILAPSKPSCRVLSTWATHVRWLLTLSLPNRY